MYKLETVPARIGKRLSCIGCAYSWVYLGTRKYIASCPNPILLLIYCDIINKKQIEVGKNLSTEEALRGGQNSFNLKKEKVIEQSNIEEVYNDKVKVNFDFTCRYCEFEIDIKDDYESHTVMKHPRRAGY